jgi:hypothetical protein
MTITEYDEALHRRQLDRPATSNTIPVHSAATEDHRG